MRCLPFSLSLCPWLIKPHHSDVAYIQPYCMSLDKIPAFPGVVPLLSFKPACLASQLRGRMFVRALNHRSSMYLKIAFPHREVSCSATKIDALNLALYLSSCDDFRKSHLGKVFCFRIQPESICGEKLQYKDEKIKSL